MRYAAGTLILLSVAIVACGRPEPEVGPGEGSAAPGEPPSTVALACQPQRDRSTLAERSSPYDSVRVTVAGADLLVCYGRPSSRNRVMIGGDNVPYGQLWRTGANEPTTMHIPFPVEIAGIAVEPGSYSLYSIPNPSEWTIIVNRSITQWGEEGSYTEEVRAQEVGRATVPAASTSAPVETFTMTAEPGDAEATHLVLEWEGSRVEIPIRRRAG
jgi:hypothetical protein